MSAPEKMTAIEISKPGGPEVLRPVKMATPRPGDGQVLIEVAAAGVNRPDAIQRLGLYPAPPGAPDTPGLEVAGTVVAVGESVDGLAAGDSVCALVAGGGYAEYCLVDAPLALPVPKGFSLLQAASLPETYFTVWTNVFEDAKLASGETLLVHGGTSGIGVAAIQLAKAFGAKVFTTCGAEEKCAAAKTLGADLAINYRTEDFRDIVKDAGGVDVVLDMVGGDYLPRNLSCLKPKGRHVSIAFLNGSQTEIDFMPVMLKRLRLSGSTLRARPLPEKAAIAAALREKVWPLFETGALKPVIDATFPLAEAANAHARLETSAHVGKIMLEP
ncbi:MAG: NAD(P)H-quinone oxidoreductase [Pseudomonadota bacterium]